MRLDVLMRRVEGTKNTDKFEPDGEPSPMDNFYVNSKAIASLPFDTAALRLTLSSEPFGDGEVERAFPPVPFYRASDRVVRYQHRDKGRTVTSTTDLPVTLAYVYRSALEGKFVEQRKPIYFGISPVIEDEKQVVDIAVDDETSHADAIAAFDAFLRESVRRRRGGRLTSRRVWAAWAARWGAEPDERVIAGVRYTDVARRLRTVFGTVAEPNPTRIDGRLQRYWSDFTIQPVSD